MSSVCPSVAGRGPGAARPRSAAASPARAALVASTAFSTSRAVSPAPSDFSAALTPLRPNFAPGGTPAEERDHAGRGQARVQVVALCGVPGRVDSVGRLADDRDEAPGVQDGVADAAE